MNKVLLLVVAVLVLGAGAYFLMQKSTPGDEIPTDESVVQQESSEEEVVATNEVAIKDFAFSPQTITIKVGDSVTWTNNDVTGHSATADDGSFDTGVLAQGETGTVTFDAAGTYPYHCTPHPNMQATVVVEP